MKYNRKFARSQWRRSFNGNFSSPSRNPGGDNSFRIFTGRCQK